jgi:hypothetical protein
MAPRLIALVAAVAMVVGALVIRDRLDTKKVERATHLELLCATELADACDAIASSTDATISVTVEDAGKTADRLVDATSVGFDGWLTPGPFAAMVGEVRRSRGLQPLAAKSTATGVQTRVGIVMWKDRAAALAAFCKIPVVDWKCLGNAAGRQWKDVGGQEKWGEVKVALPDPKTTAAGLLVLGAATTSYYGHADLSSTTLQEDDAFGAWLLGLAGAVRDDADLARMMAAGPSVVDAVGVLEQSAVPVIDTSARKNDVTVIYPSPVVTAGVVLGFTNSKAAERLAEVATGPKGRAALTAGGWRTAPGGASNLPSPGLLFALRSQWPQ